MSTPRKPKPQPVPANLTITDVWENMTPEDRAMFEDNWKRQPVDQRASFEKMCAGAFWGDR